MAYLGIPQNTIAVLQKYYFNFQKKFGQNFLIDTTVLDRIISSAEITKEDCVLEIGPGIGTMTQYLAEAAREVAAVEIDSSLIPILKDTLKEWDNVTVINNDILKTDIKKIADEKNGGKPVKVVANLPYYITTPIIMGLFESNVPIDNITVMVQKEVAERICATPQKGDYGALSVAVALRGKASITRIVKRDCFTPAPNVDSAVVRIELDPAAPTDQSLYALVGKAFAMKRKTLVNNLAAGFGFDKSTAAELFVSLGFSPPVRAEQLSPNDFIKLDNAIKNLQKS